MPDPEPLPDRSSPSRRRSRRETPPGRHAQADGLELRSYDVGALPLLKRVFERMQLERILREHLPKDDPRTELATVTALLVLFANLLLAREPIYGVGEWAALFPPDLLGLRERDLPRIHDDRLGRCLDRMFEGIGPTLIMAVVRRVIREFAISLDELHNDSTTVSFYGAYDQAGQEGERRTADARHHLGAQQGTATRPQATALHLDGHQRRQRAGLFLQRQRQHGRRPHPHRHLGPAPRIDRPGRLPLRGRLQAGQQREPRPHRGPWRPVRDGAAARSKRGRRLPPATPRRGFGAELDAVVCLGR